MEFVEIFILLVATAAFHTLIMLVLAYLRFKKALHNLEYAGAYIYKTLKPQRSDSALIATALVEIYATSHIIPCLEGGLFSFKPWWKLAGFEQQPTSDQLGKIIMNSHLMEEKND